MRPSRAWARAVVTRRRRERDEMIEAAARFAAKLPDDLGIHGVVVFGSVARGDFNVWSDIDVLVVADNLPERGIDRLAGLQRDVPPKVQAIAWTPNELADRARKHDPIATEAVERGVVVRGELRPAQMRPDR